MVAAPPGSPNNEVRVVTHWAMCRNCKWQTAPGGDSAQPLLRARRHNQRKGHVVEVVTAHAVIIT